MRRSTVILSSSLLFALLVGGCVTEDVRQDELCESACAKQNYPAPYCSSHCSNPTRNSSPSPVRPDPICTSECQRNGNSAETCNRICSPL